MQQKSQFCIGSENILWLVHIEILFGMIFLPDFINFI